MKHALAWIALFGALLAAVSASCDAGGKGNEEALSARRALVHESAVEKIVRRGTLRVGFNSGYVPFEMTDKQGRYVGFDIDMANEMAKAMGVELQLTNTAWDGIIPALNTDKFDVVMSGMTITQERNLKVCFADPYIVVGQTILLAKKHQGTVRSVADLNKPAYTVTSMLGTTGEVAVKRHLPRCNYKSFEKETEAALEVVNGRADAFVYDLPYCAVFNAQRGEGNLVFLDEPFTYEPIAWAINKGDPDFLNWLNNFLRQVKNDGRYDRMYYKWIKSTKWLVDVQK
ncbi:transporter substrate-binding domain-containing protein [Planctomycetota bacterium]